VNIELLGIIAEIVAALATLATLLYLASQIRGSVAATRAEARRSGDSDAFATVRQIAGDPELADVFLRGLADTDSLTPIEAFRFQLVLSYFYGSLETVWKETGLGTITREEATDLLHLRKRWFLTPGGRAWWDQNGDMFSVEFRQFVDDGLKNAKE
jgi:hypothetical protein